VTLYGTPSYKEADPTSFLAISYMILFGAMFGDLGQGFIFAFTGFMMGLKKKSAVSGVLIRIGLSSMLFGSLYDSVFGIEHVLSGFLVHLFNNEGLEHLFLRPIENTNVILILSVALGIVFLLVSFVYSIFNKLKNGDIKEGLFGRNGVNGLVLFIGLLSLGGMTFYGAPLWGIKLLTLLLGMTVILLVIREPLSNQILGKLPLYHEGAGAYYMESGFELLETFLSMLSNGISFIRVGAFALNHVGLFIAFHTIASMIGTSVGDVAMFIVGNVVVIALEGLIVFIQGLRLIYYEMFSKYYTGDGRAFVGVDVGIIPERQTDYR
jgi:V/A-type H+-transporting ATPase subunit I